MDSEKPVLDVVGTVGYGLNTDNISTAGGVLEAAAVFLVLKNGIRSVGLKSGSSDLLKGCLLRSLSHAGWLCRFHPRH